MSLDPRDQTSIRIVAQMDETLCHEKARKDNLNPSDRHPLRLEKAKPLRVYDYADLNVPMLARIFDRRCRGYASLGYTMLLPASAVPGWPIEVPLLKHKLGYQRRRFSHFTIDHALRRRLDPRKGRNVFSPLSKRWFALRS
jgi:hypothetical protein